MPSRRDARAVAVGLLFASLGVMVLTLALSLLSQEAWSYAVCLGLYVAKLTVERWLGVTSPLTLALALVYGALLGAALGGLELAGYAGVVIFAWLALVVGGLLLAGRPFTVFYTHGRGLPSLHKWISYVWLATYCSSLVATAALMPHPSFVIVPTLLCVAAACLTVLISFVWFGRGNERRKTFTRGQFSIEQLDGQDPRLVEFAGFYASVLTTERRTGRASMSSEELTKEILRQERALGRASVAFICHIDGTLVGTLRCILDDSRAEFAYERELQTPFTPLREQGRVMVVGRLAIAPEFRARPDVVNGLFAAFIDLALEKDVSYVISDAYPYVLPTYLKLGFEVLFPRSDERFRIHRYGLVSHPVLLDLEQMILSKSSPDDMQFGLYDVAHPYLAERWFKRLVLRRFVRRCLRRRRPNGIQEVQAMLPRAAAA